MSKVTQGPPHVKPPRGKPGDLLDFPQRGKRKQESQPDVDDSVPDTSQRPQRRVAMDLNPATYQTYGVSNTIRRAGLRLWDTDIPNDIESPDPLKFCDPIDIGEAISTSRRMAKLNEASEDQEESGSHELASLFDTSEEDRSYIDVYGYAASIDDAIQRIAERAKGFAKRAPGENPVLCCCIGHGAQALWAHPSIKRLVRVRKQELYLDWKVKAPKKVVVELLQGFDHENGSAPGPCRKKRPIQVPTSFKRTFSMISTETKIAQSPLASISIMITLSNQLDVQKEDREIFAIIVRDFVETIDYRTFAAETLLSTPKWKGACKDSRRS